MATVQEKQFVNQVDMIWDSWLNGFKNVQNFQEELQQKTLQAFSYQKEVLNLSAKTLNTMEEEAKKVSKSWSEQVQKNVAQSNMKQGPQISDWLNNIQDITEKVQLLSWKPSHAMLDLFTTSHKQLEEAMKKSLVSQQKERTEDFKKIEELTEQLKAAHKKMLNPTN